PPSTFSTLFPYTTLFRSIASRSAHIHFNGGNPHLDISRSRGHYFGGRCWCHGISGRRGRRVGMARKKSPRAPRAAARDRGAPARSEEHTSELQSLAYLVC